MTLNLQEVARAIGAGSQPPPLEVAGWSVDTRTQNPGDVYFALRGPNHDGHDFLPAAAAQGAAAVVVGQDSRPVHPSEARTVPAELIVPDTEQALQNLAAWARQKGGGRIVARSEERRLGKE